MPFESAADGSSLQAFLRALPDDVNAVMLDVKNSQGQLLYRTSNESAIAWGAPAEQTVDLESLAHSLNLEGYYLVARMQTFSDPVCATGPVTPSATAIPKCYGWITSRTGAGSRGPTRIRLP
jgi:hypothetical protein